jgi:hypothetical protein
MSPGPDKADSHNQTKITRRPRKTTVKNSPIIIFCTLDEFEKQIKKRRLY